MQDYTPLGSTATTTVKDGILNHEKNINALRSTYSGTAFPTGNLVAGLKCYRTDLGKTYTYNGEAWDDSVSTSSLTVSGETSVPTPSTENNSKTIANTEFVHGVVSNLVNGAPDALDTLQELARALGNDPNFATTVLNRIGEKESKTDAQIEHEKLQNAIDLCLEGKGILRGATQDNGKPGVVNIPLEAGMFPIYGFPDGTFKEQPTYEYGIVVNFQGKTGSLLSLYSLNYFFDETEGLYYRIGFQGKGWNTTWHKVANTANVKKQISTALTNYAKLSECFPITDTGRKDIKHTITDLNDIKCISYPSWSCFDGAYTQTMSNCPTQVAFYLFNVRNGRSSTSKDGTFTNLTSYYYYIAQLLLDIGGNMWVRTCFNGSKETFGFGNWKKVAFINDILTRTSQLTNDSNFVSSDTLKNYALKSDVASAVRYKGSVDNYSDLPSTGVQVGWMYNIVNADPTHEINAGDNVVYNGNTWDNYNGLITIDSATDAEINALFD